MFVKISKKPDQIAIEWQIQRVLKLLLDIYLAIHLLILSLIQQILYVLDFWYKIEGKKLLWVWLPSEEPF